MEPHWDSYHLKRCNITDYPINDDANPEVITKRVTQQLEYVQELAIRYLRPPTPPSAGEIVITQEVYYFIFSES